MSELEDVLEQKALAGDEQSKKDLKNLKFQKLVTAKNESFTTRYKPALEAWVKNHKGAKAPIYKDGNGVLQWCNGKQRKANLKRQMKEQKEILKKTREKVSA